MHLLIFLAVFSQVNSQYCPERCVCMNQMGFINCDGARNPNFQYDNRIKRVYMTEGYLDNVLSMINKFPSLDHLTLERMVYVNCKELNEISDDITVHGDSCGISSSTKRGKLYTN